MRRDDVLDLVQRIPPADHTKVVLVLRSLHAIAVDLFFRPEETYLVVRGREAGTNDESRGFFVPYDEIVFLKIERVVKISDLKTMYGMPLTEGDDERKLDTDTPAPAAAAPAAPAVAPAPAMDPAAIAKQNLLDRIRAARTSAGGAPKPGK